MKKFLLSAAALCMISFTAFSQAFTDTDPGYTVDFLSTSADPSCLQTCCAAGTGGYAFADGNIGTPAPSNLADYLEFTAIASPVVGPAPGYFDFYFTNGLNCETMRANTVAIDMSSNSKVKIRAKSTTAGAELQFWLASGTTYPGDGSSTYSTTGGGGVAIPFTMTLTTTMTDYEFDYTDSLAKWNAWGGKSAVTMFGFTVNTASAVYQVEKVQVGADVVSGVQSAVLPASVKLYPNPSTDLLNVDLSSLNLDGATLKLMNSNGAVVKEETNVSSISVAELNSGLYFLQINNFKPVKVVVE